MYRRLFILLIALIFTGTLFDTVKAQTVPGVPEYTGINLMLIIDQSGSMGGTPYGGPAIYDDGNDPFGLRFAGPQYVVKWLTGFHQTVVAVEKPDLHLGVISFGTAPRPLLDWEEIDSGNPAQLAELDEDLSATRFGPRNLQDTDFQRAFASARDMFNRRPTPTGGGRYLDVVVVLTDGGPCTAADPGFSFVDADGNIRYNCQVNSSGSVDVLGTMTERLQTLAGFVSDQMPHNNYEFYVIALDANGSFWPVLEGQNQLWTEVICPGSTCNDRLQRVTDPSQIGRLLQSILVSISNEVSSGVLKQAQIPIPGGTFTIPPYQQLARISVFKNADALLDNLAFAGPAGVVTPDGDTTNTPIDVFNLNDPQPGGWQVTGIDATQVASMSVDFIAYGLQSVGVSSDQEMLSTIPLEVALVDGNGNVAAHRTDYPLTVTAMIYEAELLDRNSRPLLETITLTLDATNPGEARFVGQWVPLTPGRYEIRVSATYPGATELLVNDQTVVADLQVAGSTVEWSGIQPTSQREDMGFTSQAVIRNNTTGDLIGNTTDLVTQITLIDVATGGEVFNQILSNEANAPGQLAASFQYPMPGDYRAVMQAGVFDANDVFVPVGNPSNPLTLTVRPVRSLDFAIISPHETTMDAQRIRLIPRFEFDLNVPVTLRVQLTDEDGNLVSLGSVTNGQQTKPNVVLNPGANARDLTAELVETSTGVYAIELDDLGVGTFEFAISSSVTDDQLVGDYEWGTQTGTLTLRRNWSPALLYIGIGGLLAVVITGGIGAFFIERRRRMRIAPLNGSLGFILQHPDGRRETMSGFVSFENENLNRRMLKKDALQYPFEQFLISTDGDERGAERGQVYIRKIKMADDNLRLTRQAAEGEIRLRDKSEEPIAEAGDGTLFLIVRNPEFGPSGSGDVFENLRSNQQ